MEPIKSQFHGFFLNHTSLCYLLFAVLNGIIVQSNYSFSYMSFQDRILYFLVGYICYFFSLFLGLRTYVECFIPLTIKSIRESSPKEDGPEYRAKIFVNGCNFVRRYSGHMATLIGIFKVNRQFYYDRSVVDLVINYLIILIFGVIYSEIEDIKFKIDDVEHGKIKHRQGVYSRELNTQRFWIYSILTILSGLALCAIGYHSTNIFEVGMLTILEGLIVFFFTKDYANLAVNDRTKTGLFVTPEEFKWVAPTFIGFLIHRGINYFLTVKSINNGEIGNSIPLYIIGFLTIMTISVHCIRTG